MRLVIVPTVLLLASANAAALHRRLDNGVGITPALGWNNYNAGLEPSAENALNAANAFVSLGLRDLGYKYINMDDTWSASTRDSNGNLQADPTKFPNGIPALVDEIHNMSLSFGLYGDSGTATCSGFPGSEGYESQDAALLSSWGVDYWKYDNCNTPSGNSQPRYETMRDALLAQSHTILYSLCQWGADNVATWGATVGNSWRISSDATNGWSSVVTIASGNAGNAEYAAPGGFNDMDMMEIGNGVLTTPEERSYFGLWAILKSPIILGTDLTKINSSSLAIIKNKGVISISQDSLGLAAAPFSSSTGSNGELASFWAGPLSDGVVVGLLNPNDAATLSVDFSDVPGLGAGTWSWTEFYTGQTGTSSSVSFALDTHDMAVIKVTTSS